MTPTTCTARTATAARPATADAVLRDLAFALKMARRVSHEIRREAAVPPRVTDRTAAPARELAAV
jgi:hypothetical protein